MNDEAELEIERLHRDAPRDVQWPDLMREAMRWAYADAAKIAAKQVMHYNGLQISAAIKARAK